MKRIDFIQKSCLGLVTLPFLDMPTKNPREMIEPERTSFGIGKFAFTIYKDFLFKYQAGDYFINASPAELEQNLKKYNFTSGVIPSPYIAMLLQDGQRKILVDSGIGYAEKPIVFKGKEIFLKGRLQELLKEDGISGSEVTDVILTHFHPDHIGGTFSGNQMNFPNAEYHIYHKEWDYWHSSESDSQPGLFKHFVQENVTPLKERKMHLIGKEFEEILPGIVPVLANGHTPGQMALVIGDSTESLLYISDSFLHPLHMEHLDWRTNYDMDHDMAKRTRIKLLEMAREGNMLINAFHFDFPGLGRAGYSNGAWKWNPENK